MPLLEPKDELVIAIDIPLDHKYIHNAERIILAEISGEKPDNPILTPLGLAFAEDALLSRIDEPENVSDDKNDDNIEWEEDNDDSEVVWEKLDD